MALTPGSRLGVYEVTAQIGEGGMGQVYRATDTTLKRQVAIKILPASLAADADRLARFQREAEVLASLNHPHIAGIYGIEVCGGVRALVLELVEGPTLADRIAQGPIPIDEAMPIAKQIAEALEAAHEQGIVHRDLKPANIKVRPDGTVKVLDFGLAKVMESSGAASADASQSPTIWTPAMSQAGMILGTPAYMSPEQARGRPVDRRADVWAFGCVLYEMLTGRGPFAGETSTDTIAKALEREPDWHALPASTPPRLRELLRRCLQKDQNRRLHDIADARIEIEDAQTGQSRSQRVVRTLAVVGVVAVALTLLASAWWYGGRSIPAVRHEPMSVIIADFQNRTNDPVFDRTLEPFLRMVLEDAHFISAYDRNRVSSSLGVRPPETLDGPAAREIAVKQGLGVVLSGSIDRRGNGYDISVKAVQTVTGDVIAREESPASSKEQVLGVVTRLVANVRKALGDDPSDSAQLFAMRSVSATSLDVVHHYAVAVEAQSNGKFEETRQSALRAVELDPKFGIGYQLLAAASLNLGNLQDAEKYSTQALTHLDGMTDRERYAIRGMFYRITGDYQQCAKEYGEMTARYAGDAIARNQRALCLSKLRQLREAVVEIRQAVQILPKRAVLRGNLAVYSAYAGDFRAADREARTIQEPYDLATLAIAFAQLGQGLLREATETYHKLETISRRGASWAASGLGDLALYEGRFSDAVRLLEQGVDADLASKSPNKAARKLTTLAYAHLMQGRAGPAVVAADRALLNSKAREVRFLAARIFVEAGASAKALTLAEGLASELSVEPQAYGKIIEAGIALKNGEPREAVKILTDANGILDTWLGHFDLGRAYLEAGAFPQADSEFDRCVTRRGEALSLLVDEEPTYGYFPIVYYYRGRAREGLNSEGFAESYRAYLSIRGNSSEDPLVQQARRRAGL